MDVRTDIRTDKLVLLTSSDWFFPHWGYLGFWFGDRSKSRIQRYARGCAKDLVGSASEYWGVVMSNERLEKTRNQFFLGDEGRDDSSRDRGRMKIICEQILFAADVRYDKGLALFEMVVEELLAGRIVGEGLDPKLMSALRRSHDAAKSLENEIDFEQLCLNSSTTWDQFLRDLTPDLPTFLSDFVFQVSSSTRAQARWVSLFDTLEPAELEAAIRWYRDKARSLGADVKELEIPAWIPQ